MFLIGMSFKSVCLLSVLLKFTFGQVNEIVDQAYKFEEGYNLEGYGDISNIDAVKEEDDKGPCTKFLDHATNCKSKDCGLCDNLQGKELYFLPKNSQKGFSTTITKFATRSHRSGEGLHCKYCVKTPGNILKDEERVCLKEKSCGRKFFQTCPAGASLGSIDNKALKCTRPLFSCKNNFIENVCTENLLKGEMFVKDGEIWERQIIDSPRCALDGAFSSYRCKPNIAFGKEEGWTKVGGDRVRPCKDPNINIDKICYTLIDPVSSVVENDLFYKEAFSVALDKHT